MRLLIAVKSCKHDADRGFHDVIRKTWGQNLPAGVDLRFFTGIDPVNGFVPDDESEIVLGCPDSYMELPRKTRAILNWSFWNDYDFTFLVDTDTFVDTKKLLSSGFDKYDYSGRIGLEHPVGTTFRYKDAYQAVEQCHPWASGGVGYFVSRTAANIIRYKIPDHWAEDLWVGQIVGPLVQTELLTAANLPDFECSVAWHFPRRKYNNEKYDLKFGWMESMYKEHR